MEAIVANLLGATALSLSLGGVANVPAPNGVYAAPIVTAQVGGFGVADPGWRPYYAALGDATFAQVGNGWVAGLGAPAVAQVGYGWGAGPAVAQVGDGWVAGLGGPAVAQYAAPAFAALGDATFAQGGYGWVAGLGGSAVAQAPAPAFAALGATGLAQAGTVT